MTRPILETEGLTKRFGSLIANDRLSVTVEEDTIHGIMGPNGSGKSTFFNTVTGCYRPDGGTVRFDGEDVTGWKPDEIARRGLARTFQIPSPFEDLTVKENMLAVFTGGLRSSVRIPEEKRVRADELLELLEIDHVADQEAGGISGGQEKLLELGRILMLEPACVMLDEPTAGVNPSLRNRLLDHLQTLNDRGTTFVIIEHDMRVIADVCDRVTVFNQGQVIVEGDFESVTNDERVRDAYLGNAAEHDASLETLIGEGANASAAEEAESPDPGATPDAGTDPGSTGSADAVPAGGTSEAASAAASTASALSGIGTESDGDPWLVGEDLVSGYGNHTVVDGVSVESRDGVTCVFGPNGSGKSTLLKTLAGVVPAWEGTITHRGVDVTDNRPAENVDRGVTMLPQDGGIFGDLTVRENLLLGGYTVDDGTVREERFDEVLTSFPELEGKLDERGQSLSGGQQMMLSYGRAMMTGAEVYLLDEPSSGLAPSLIDQVFEMTRRLVESGAQVILIEQNVREALRIADYVYILAQGQLQFEGTPGDLTDEDDLVELYLGLD
ncbi:branched-chain amino acid transport system ATP-binding protein [Halorubrum trapanicum]|uniref:Branched-chain amino acid transport system ATP-binding protein n=1 Tax=Halorubrum trapanicum TaxID=29284 RepID=A0A8J7UPG6_9EURY|nr:ATP-binding cassette domain-containing protein [Halorubrum trapanicum]MBP1902881.1 branched-chain amino acid transport system ATP-binding protein [Halorubrum trapanicum]